MELKEAIQAADREYDAEFGVLKEDELAEAAALGYVGGDHLAIRQSGILAKINYHREPGFEISVMLCMAIRFGMRVQRKLDHPERVTTYRHTEG